MYAIDTGLGGSLSSLTDVLVCRFVKSSVYLVSIFISLDKEALNSKL